jgi:hypothetical protein
MVTSSVLLNQPFKGGIMVPDPGSGLITLLTVSGAGEVTIASQTPSPAPSVPLYFQDWITDSGGPHGYSSSNGLQVGH